MLTHSEHGSEPEGGLRECDGERADVRPADRVVIEVIQHEVRHKGAPYRDVVEHRPVCCV